MKLPEPVLLPGGLVASGHYARRPLQAHVVKHWLGLGTAPRGTLLGASPLTGEGWDVPEALWVAWKATVGGRCGLPIVSGARAPDSSAVGACYSCQGPLADCERVTRPGRDDYTGQTLDVLRAVRAEVGMLIDRELLYSHIRRMWEKPEMTQGLVIGFFGGQRAVDEASQAVAHSSQAASTRSGPQGTDVESPHVGPLVRLNRSDGVRVELRRIGKALEWRTTYRKRTPTAGARVSWLLDAPRGDGGWGPLAAQVLVPKDWWDRHGNA